MKEIVLNEQEIQEIVKRMANELKEKFKDSNSIPVFIGVLKGSLPFMMDLMKYYDLPLIQDFIQVSSYDGTESTGVIHLKKDITEDIKNKNIVIVEDIIDTGTTLAYLKQYFKVKYQPRSITIISFLDKKPLRKVDLEADIVGVSLNKNQFLVGYGLDYNEINRNVPYIFIPDEQDLEKWNETLKNNK